MYEFLRTTLLDILRHIEESNSKQERAIREATQSWEKKQPEVGTTIAAAIKTAADSVPEYEKRQRKKEHNLQWGMFWITLFGAVAATAAAVGAFYYAGIAKGQLNEMHDATVASQCAAETAARALAENQRQFQITSDNSNRQFQNTLGEVRKQTKAQIKSAKAAKDAADTAKDALHISQRAYIEIGAPVLEETTLNPPRLKVPIFNEGQIPSGEVTVRY